MEGLRFAIVAVAALLGLCEGSCVSTCSNPHIDEVARVVFGESRGESLQGQIAVAYTIVNRVTHPNYPNSISAVVNAKYGTHHEYNTLDEHSHDTAWANAKRGNSHEYQNAIKATKSALCNCVSDPTTCGVAYCAYDPCSATSDNKYTEAHHKTQIGHHYFVCRRAIVG